MVVFEVVKVSLCEDKVDSGLAVIPVLPAVVDRN